MRYILSENELFGLSNRKENLLIHCEEGTLWITRSGDFKDYILKPGEIHEIKRVPTGKIVILAMRKSIFTLRETPLKQREKRGKNRSEAVSRLNLRFV